MMTGGGGDLHPAYNLTTCINKETVSASPFGPHMRVPYKGPGWKAKQGKGPAGPQKDLIKDERALGQNTFYTC